MKDCYYDLGLHFILLDDCSQSYILKLRDRVKPVGKRYGDGISRTQRRHGRIPGSNSRVARTEVSLRTPTG